MDEFVRRLVEAMKQEFGGFMRAADSEWEKAARGVVRNMGLKHFDSNIYTLDMGEEAG